MSQLRKETIYNNKKEQRMAKLKEQDQPTFQPAIAKKSHLLDKFSRQDKNSTSPDRAQRMYEYAQKYE